MPLVSIDGRDLLVAMAIGIGVLAALLAAVILLGAIVRPGRSAATVIDLVFGFAAYAGVFAAVWLAVVAVRGRRAADMGLRPCSLRLRWTGVMLGFAWVAASCLFYGATGQWDTAMSGGRSLVRPYLQGGISFILLMALAGPVAAFVEETVFRGLLYGWLRQKTGVAIAAMSSSLLFTAAHFYVYSAGIVFVVEMVALAIVLALLFEYSRSLWPGILCHAANNLAVLGVYLIAG
ncbi:MAG: CPBP family intramembrane glutamic endopeptidase [Alphaproteobacteria bacterium]